MLGVVNFIDIATNPQSPDPLPTRREGEFFKGLYAFEVPLSFWGRERRVGEIKNVSTSSPLPQCWQFCFFSSPYFILQQLYRGSSRGRVASLGQGAESSDCPNRRGPAWSNRLCAQDDKPVYCDAHPVLVPLSPSCHLLQRIHSRCGIIRSVCDCRARPEVPAHPRRIGANCPGSVLSALAAIDRVSNRHRTWSRRDRLAHTRCQRHPLLRDRHHAGLTSR